jgi:hypothetical protein
MRRLAHSLRFALLTALLFVLSLGVAARAHYGRHTLLQVLTHNYVEPGGKYQSLRRFREAQERGHVDVAFLGPSRAYRGFDPRVFEAAGLSVMNLGSNAQTPINTRYVAARYLPHLAPRLVVMEVSYSALENDGVESCNDLMVNTPWSWGLERMAIETLNAGTFSFATAKALGLAGDESRATQREWDGETYVPGGYCEVRSRRTPSAVVGPVAFELKRRQLDNLVEATALAGSFGARVVWVSMPAASDYVARIVDRETLRSEIEASAKRAGVTYWDLDGSVSLDPSDDFSDTLHLNAEGVAKVDRALIERLRAASYLAQ